MAFAFGTKKEFKGDVHGQKTVVCDFGGAARIDACGGRLHFGHGKGTPAAEPKGGNAPAATPKNEVTLTALLDNNATFPYSKDWPI
ncbi:hypothetical protein VQ056_05990 [Paenibacillus sp. JTLBN-2024]